MKRLDDPHGWPTGPKEFARCGEFKLDHEITQAHRTDAGIRVEDDSRGNRIGQTQIVRGCHAINKDSALVPPFDHMDELMVVGSFRLFRQKAQGRFVIESTPDPAEFTGLREALQRFVNCVAVAEIQKVRGRPNGFRLFLRDSLANGFFERRRLAGHESKFSWRILFFKEYVSETCKYISDTCALII